MLRNFYFSILFLAFLSPGFIGVASADMPQNIPARINGTVTSIINTKQFTYIEVQTGKKKVWAAGPVSKVKKGDSVSFPASMAMKNYHSKALDHDFAVLYITNSFYEDTKQPAISKHAVDPDEVKVGGYLRDMTLDGLNTSSKTFAAFKGKPLIINTWASWCSPCRSEMGSLQRLAQRFNGNAFNIIGISTDDFRNKAEALIKQDGISFENFIDHNQLVEKMLGAKTIPLTV
ncbi:MAG: TlpA disulfide reductase family protein, partial [Gammaproteobacteria bacterium]|nr:TlpA disulfide reductase family protein [Gammaproteobacteria bacterium]